MGARHTALKKSSILECNYLVGIVGTFDHDYGSDVTHFALYRALCDEGYATLVIGCPEDAPCRQGSRESAFSSFMFPPYSSRDMECAHPNKESMIQINKKCESFILVDDLSLMPSNVWRHGNHGYLGWVRTNRRKIAYAASFGGDSLKSKCTRHQKAEMSFFLKRFDSFSVGERSATDLSRNELGIESEFVLSPIFLCRPEHYLRMSMLGKGRMPKGKFMGSYLHTPKVWKADLVRSVSKRLGLDEVNVLPMGTNPEEEWKFHTLENVRTEEWIASIVNCEFLVTDSFHAICFAIIFKRQFIALFDDETDIRVKDILDMAGLAGRIIKVTDGIEPGESSFTHIDYSAVDDALDVEIERSRKWLLDSISKQRKIALKEYDLIMDSVLGDRKMV